MKDLSGYFIIAGIIIFITALSITNDKCIEKKGGKTTYINEIFKKD